MGPSLAMVSFFIPQWLRTITDIQVIGDGIGGCIGYVTMDIPYPQLAIGETGYVIGEKY